MRSITLALTFMLLASETGNAMPLRLHDSWTWEVFSPTSYTTHQVTATVIDSQSVDSGSIWKLDVRTSTGAIDTCSLFSDGKGYQAWVKRSDILGVELVPFDSSKDVVRSVGTETTSRWGEGFCAYSAPSPTNELSFSNRDHKLTCTSHYDVYSSHGIPTRTSTTNSYPFPTWEWNDTLGFVRFRTYGTPFDKDWRLTRHNADAIKASGPSVSIPAKGNETSWMVVQEQVSILSSWSMMKPGATFWTRYERSTTRTASFLSWTILASTPDTGGWFDLTIQESMRIRSARDMQISRYTEGSNPTSESSSESPAVMLGDTTHQIRARVNSSTGEYLGSPASFVPEFHPEQGWIQNWDETFAGGCSYPSANSVANGLRKRNATVDSFWYARTVETNSSDFSTSSKSYAINAWLATPDTRTSPRMNTPQGVSALLLKASTYPSTMISWRNALGQQGRVPAGELVRSSGGSTTKYVVLEAVFPDGTRWKGPFLLR